MNDVSGAMSSTSDNETLWKGGEGAGKLVRGWAFNNVFGRQGGRLYEVALIRGWALIRIHTNLFTPDNSID